MIGRHITLGTLLFLHDSTTELKPPLTPHHEAVIKNLFLEVLPRAQDLMVVLPVTWNLEMNQTERGHRTSCDQRPVKQPACLFGAPVSQPPAAKYCVQQEDPDRGTVRQFLKASPSGILMRAGLRSRVNTDCVHVFAAIVLGRICDSSI